MTLAGQGCGLTDKLYWRQVGGRWHCFRRIGNVWISLCERFQITRTGGQAIDRPEVWKRCGLCDGAEMGRREKAESLPARRDLATVAREVRRDRERSRAAVEHEVVETPRWEHGDRCHGLWLGAERLAHIGLSPPGFPPLRYTWRLDGVALGSEVLSLRRARRAVERALGLAPARIERRSRR